MNEQQSEMAAVQETTTSACPHPEAVGKRWGDPISEERQAVLQAYLDRWKMEAHHRERIGPFDRRGFSDNEQEHPRLTGADVFWLAVQSGLNESGLVSDFHLERADLYEAHLEGARLGFAHLNGVILTGAHLEGADLFFANVNGASLMGAYLEDAHLAHARLNGTLLSAHMKNASLWGADLQGATLGSADLEGADLRGAWFNEETNLDNARLGPGTGVVGDWLDRLRKHNRNAALGDIRWRGANLTNIPWERVYRLGDERDARSPTDRDGEPKNHDKWITGYKDAARANRQLATVLRSQGLSEDADRFAYRAQICQRAVFLRTFRLGRWLFSWLLFILAGYGYRPLRTLFWYLAIIFGFTFLYMHFGHISGHPFAFDESLVFSVTSFHGRGFFPGALALKDVVTKLAASEAVLGLFIEVSFIATFTQRYFGK